MSESGSSVADDGDRSDDNEAISDSEQTGSQEAEQLYQPKISAAKDLKNRYASYADWETDFLPYQKESFQTFVVDDSQRLSKDHKLKS